MLGAQPANEEQPPAENPLANDPPFDFLGLGQPAQEAEPQPDEEGELDHDHQQENDWGQWIAGGVDAAPATQAEHFPVVDLNMPVKNWEIDLNEHLPMDINLNDVPELNIDIPAPEADQEEDMQEELTNISIPLSALTVNDLQSNSSVQGELAEAMEAAQNSTAHQSEDNADDGAFFLPEDLLQNINNLVALAINQEAPQVNQNLQVGLILYQDPMVEDPILENFTMQIEAKA
jgi:hypothetical protein